MTSTETDTPTATPTDTRTATDTRTPTYTRTYTDSPTATRTPTFSASPTRTDTPSVTSTRTATQTVTPTETHSPVPNVGITVQVLNSAGEVVYAGPLMMFNHGLTGVTTTDGAFVPGSGVDAVFQLQGAGGTFSWNGLNSSGQAVQAGVYTVEFVQTNSSTTGTFPTQVTVLSSQNQGSVSIFNSAGELVQYFPLISGSAAYLSFSESSLVPGTSGVKISWGPDGADSVTWNGLNSSGAQVASGVYKVVVTTQSPGSPEITLVGSIQVVDPASDLLSGAVVAPNPLGAPGQSLTIYAPGLGASDSLAIGLYDLAGQLVVQSYGEGPKQSLTVPSSAAGGIYLVVLRAHSAETGVNQRKVCKLAVIP